MTEFAGSLREVVAIEKQEDLRSAEGAQAGEWSVVASCRAVIVPDGSGAEAEGMTLSQLPRFRVTVRRRSDILIQYRLRWGERRLAIRQIIDDPRLSDRLVLRCEELR